MNIRKSAEFIASHSRHVKVVDQGVKSAALELSHQMQSMQYDCKQWKKNELHPQDNTKETVDW